MVHMNIPNSHNVTVESGPNSKGEGAAVVAVLWSQDQTAQQDKRWVRYDTETEADSVAASLAEANWDQIEAWHKNA